MGAYFQPESCGYGPGGTLMPPDSDASGSRGKSSGTRLNTEIIIFSSQIKCVYVRRTEIQCWRNDIAKRNWGLSFMASSVIPLIP